MIVQQFLCWIRTAPADDRADATSALARAYLYSDLEPADRAAAEAAMIVLLDDPSPAVRAALAHALGSSPLAPLPVIHALARERGEVATTVLAQSPLLTDSDLIEILSEGDWRAQVAIACRLSLSPRVVAAIAATASPDACQAVVENEDIAISSDAYRAMLDRHGDDASLRNAILARRDLPLDVRQTVVVTLSKALASFVSSCGWLSDDRATRLSLEARDQGTVAIAQAASDDERADLAAHLRSSGQLTASLILRTLLSGDLALVEAMLAELSGLPQHRVSALVAARHPASYEALHAKAGLPAKALPAFRAALDTLHEQGFVASRAGKARLSRRMVERVLTSVGAIEGEDVAPLMALLRRFVAEAAREEARVIADDVAADALLAA